MANKSDFRRAPAAAVADALGSAPNVGIGDIKAALINVLERVASLEKDRDELEQLLEAFNEQVDAAKLHGPGLLNEQ